MSARTIRLSLRAGERIYINGAVLRVDRKTELQLLNDATFLLEPHVLQPEQATTPLRQLYFLAQTILMDPGDAARGRAMFAATHSDMLRVLSDRVLAAEIEPLGRLVEQGRVFDAMKRMRGLFPLEDGLQGSPAASGGTRVAVTADASSTTPNAAA